jgi:predicted DCC family thiol-disulfide oxidoreductase YuxK
MNSIILFDGVCNFCNGAVNFVIRNDRKGRFKFAPLQSETGNQLRAEHNIGDDVDSIVLIEDGEAYTLSTAALRIARGLDGIWKLAYALIIIPKSIRDRVYRVIANNRYRWFGKKDACMVPTPDFLSEPPA